MKQLKVDIETFKFSPKEFRIIRNTDGVIYAHRFPVIKHNNITSLEGEITILGDTGEVLIDVFNLNRTFYSPFYNNIYGDFAPILSKIHEHINQELNRLGIKQNDARTVRKAKKG